VADVLVVLVFVTALVVLAVLGVAMLQLFGPLAMLGPLLRSNA
jgi:hypothetical protein